LSSADGRGLMASNETSEGPTSLGTCPRCGGTVIEGKRGYGCANWREADGACRFVIWKRIAGREIPPEMASALIRDRKIGPVDGFVSKAGNSFAAHLRLVDDEERWRVDFHFPDRAPEETVKGSCPVCGGEIIESQKGYGCANWREADGGCRFVIWKRIAGREISPRIAETLLAGGITDLLFGFTSRRGKAFSARLKLSAGGEEDLPRVVFDFPDRA
jgi:DNA topoisomerase III